MARKSTQKRQINNVYLTAKGLLDVKTELEYLKGAKREELAQRINIARGFGDLSENSEYDAAMNEQDLVENRISQLEGVVKNAKIISEEEHKSCDFVVIGSTVKIEMDNEIDEFTIVGRVEADPSKKKISNESPLGASLLGAKPGETVEVTTPILKYKCKILEVK